MMYEHIVNRLRQVYCHKDASAIEEHVAIQFNIWGEGHGALYMEIDDGKIHIEPYEYYDRDTIISTDAETLLGIAAGRIDPCTYGDLCVEGDSSRVAILRDLSMTKADREEDKRSAEGAVSEEGELPLRNTDEASDSRKKNHPHIDAVKKTAGKAAGTVKKKAGEAAEAAREKAGEAAGTVKKKAGEAAEAAREKAGEAAGTVKKKAGEAAGAAREKAGEAAGTVKKKAGEAAEAAKEKVEEAAGSARGKAGEVADSVKKKVGRRKAHSEE